MKSIYSYILIPIALFTMFFLTSPVQAQPLESNIRVGIWSNQQSVLISSDTDFEIVNGETGQLLEMLSANENAIISFKGKDIAINGRQVAAVKLSILKLEKARDSYIQVNKRRYRGDIDIHITNGKIGLTVVNSLPIEQYLYGIIAKEISPSWHLEAVKAQAVAARTYALYNMNNVKKHQGDDYDVCATTDCQVYGGRESEVPRAIEAVDSTYGQVIMYQNKVIPAYFHSSSGGYTENSENVWGTFKPYLRGVVDYDQNSPYFKWEKKLTIKELAGAISKAGYNIGTIKAIELAPNDNQAMIADERGVSGRVKMMHFIGTNGSAQITGEKVRRILDLKSTLFDISIMEPSQKDLEFEIVDTIGNHDSKKVEMNLPPQKDKKLFTDTEEIHRLSGRLDEMVVISGSGWGHGIGMSQWGAKAMAEKGPQGDTTYFKEILKHYYQGVEIKKVF